MVSQCASVLLLLFSTPGVWMINFPGSAQRFVFGRQSTYPMESCSTTGIVAKVTLAVGEGRQFQSTNYPSGYGTQISCTYNFEPASGAQLVFSCDDFDLTATSATGALCTGDYLRFYDSTGSLGSSGDRYCYNTAPSFTYPNNIFVLFKTNNDGTSGRGYDCKVVAESTTTTTTTTTTIPPTTDCITIGGPGATKPCMQYTYGSGRTPYDGCINRDTPGRYVSVVPSFGDNSPAPRDEQDFFTEFDIKVRDDANSRISFGGSISSRSTSTRHVKEIRSLFWCATAVDPSGYVME